jgi:hypothetical protein
MATLYPQLGWGMGWLPVNTGSSMLKLFLRKNYTLCHPFKDLDIGRWK